MTDAPAPAAAPPPSVDLRGRVALVTGGGSGIGAGIATTLAAAGARTVLVGRRAERLQGVGDAIVAAGGSADTVECDLSDGERAGALIDSVVERAGQVDVLVHAAGHQVRGPSIDYRLADWDAIVNLHVRSAFILSQALGRHLVGRSAPGSIIYIGSMASERWGIPEGVAYSVAKSGLLGLARSLAVEWAPQRIRVNTILVGFVSTEMTRDIEDTPARRAITSRIPFGRVGTAAEIGDAAAFLASDLSSYVTGEALTVDGGWSVA